MKQDSKDDLTLREELLAADDLGGEEITVERWGKKIWVRELNGAERNELFEKSMERGKMVGEKLFVNAVILCACDPETKKRIFAFEDAPAVSKKNGVSLDEIATVAYRLNGIGEYDVKEAEKN